MALKDVALSSGSACTSASLEPSYVLRAIGTDEDLAHSSLRYLYIFINWLSVVKCNLPKMRICFRFGFSRFTTIEEVDYTVERVIKYVERLRSMRYEEFPPQFTRHKYRDNRIINFLRVCSPLWEMFQEGIDLKSIKWTQH